MPAAIGCTTDAYPYLQILTYNFIKIDTMTFSHRININP